MNDIASECGCSRATVNHILLGRGERFAAATRQRVMDTAARMGYRVNTSARAIKTGRFDCVSLVLGTKATRGSVPAGLLIGIEERLADQGIHLALYHSRESVADSGELQSDPQRQPGPGGPPKFITQDMVDGHMVDMTWPVPQWVKDLGQGPLPVVKLGMKAEWDCAYVDEEQGGHAATQHLIELGHTDIACVGGPTDFAGALARRAGYERAMKEAGLKTRNFMFEDNPEVRETSEFALPEIAFTHDRYQQSLEWLANEDQRPTALFGVWFNDVLPMQAAALRLGLDLPGDLSIVAVHDYFVGLGMPITTFFAASHGLGLMAAELMLTKLDHPKKPLPPAVLSYVLAGGVTTGPPCRPS
ncbi:MAG: LacI family DNA-binding transcriptional regulator [Planctomycetota bacterium]